MLTHPTRNKLQVLNLTGMVKALDEQFQSDLYEPMTFEERLGLMVDREMTERDNRRLKTRLNTARLRQSACLEDLNLKLPRSLDRAVIQQLATCHWIKKSWNVFITGATGVGKTYLACALAQKACREGYDTLYLRAPLLFQDLALAKADGRYRKLLGGYSKKRLLVLDDWGLAPLDDEHRRDLLELVEDRHGRGSLIVVSQVPVDKWHAAIGDPTLADAIMDRIIHNAYRIALKGGTIREHYARLATEQDGGDKNGHQE